MKIRNGDTPIQLPEIVRAGDAITARWANGMRSALQRLRDRTPVAYGSSGGGTAYNHPFKLSAAVVSGSLRLYANYGQVFQAWLRSWDTFPTTPDAQSQQQTITIGGGSLANHPDGTTAGYLTLAASTTYGIWLKGSYAGTGTSTDYFSSPSLGFGYVTVDGYTLFFDRIAAESTYTTPASKPDNGEVWLFLGSVDVDANLVPTIVQWWKSDVLCPSWNMPRIEASTDTGNSLLIGSDGKLFVPPIVSGDANNDITAGSDGGAFYDAP